MSRISDLAATNRILEVIFETQERARESELRVASGKVSQTYDNIFLQSQRLVTIENLNTEVTRFQQTNTIADLRLDIAGTATEGALDVVRDFRTRLSDFRNATNDQLNVDSIQEAAFDSLIAIQDLLNTQADGIYVFSGSKYNTPPVDLRLTSLADFQTTYDGASTVYPDSREAHLANFTIANDFQNEDRLFTTDTNYLTFRQDDDGDNSNGGRSSIEATSDLFRDMVANTQITISDTASNNGTYTIDEVSADGTKIFIKTEMLTNESSDAALSNQGLNAGLADENNVATGSIALPAGSTATAFGDLTFANATGIITDNAAGGTIGASGLSIGDVIEVTGTVSNDGFYTVSAVGTDTITIDTDATPTVTITGSAGTPLTLTDMGSVFFDNANSQITAETTNAFSALQVNELITIAGSDEAASGNDNDGIFRITAKSGDTLTVENAMTITLADPDNTLGGTAILDVADTGGVTFSRTANTFTAVNANSFSNASVGEVITVANTINNNGTYTITNVSSDGRTVTVDSTKLNDEGTSSTKYFGQESFTQVVFTNNGGTGTDTIQIQDNASAALDIFSQFKVGQSFTLSGATTGGNDQTYTINAISPDGSTVTVDQAVTTTAPDTASITINGAANHNFTYVTQTNLEFSATNRITVHDDADNTINGSFDALRIGQTITIGNSTSNDGTYLISDLDPNGGYIEVTDTDGNPVTFTAESGVAATTLDVFAADGTIVSSNSYYQGDTISSTQRVDSDRSYEWDITAINPAFEKAIRAMGIIAQGSFGTEGGLDQNRTRVEDALFLIDHATQPAPPTRTGFNELSGNIRKIIGDIGFDKYIIEQTNQRHQDFSQVFTADISDIEDADQLEAITELLDDGRALEASYQALSRIEELSLVNFL